MARRSRPVLLLALATAAVALVGCQPLPEDPIVDGMGSTTTTAAPTATTVAPTTVTSTTTTTTAPTTATTTTLPRAASPLSPSRLAFGSDRTGTWELFTMGTDGSTVRQVTADPTSDSWWPRLSPDRRTILFYKTPKGVHDSDFTVTSLWAVGTDGSAPTLLRPAGTDGWHFQGHVEWSPDGTRLVMFGGSEHNPQIFVTDPVGDHPRAVTQRPGTNIDPSFTPDGASVVFVGCPQAECRPADYEIYRQAVDGGPAVRLTTNQVRDHDPYVSPDGSRLAWLTEIEVGQVWDVHVGDAEARDPRRLAGDRGVTSKPEWSADGSHLYVHRRAPGAWRFDVYRAGHDGSDLTMLTGSHAGSNEFPSVR